MSEVRYTEYRKKQRGRYFWGVLRMEGRKQNFRTVGEGESARRKAKQLARKLNEVEQAPAVSSDRFLSWHEAGEPLQGYVLDLRNNPGGLLDQAVAVSDAFLDRGVIVSTGGRHADDEQAGRGFLENLGGAIAGKSGRLTFASGVKGM